MFQFFSKSRTHLLQHHFAGFLRLEGVAGEAGGPAAAVVVAQLVAGAVADVAGQQTAVAAGNVVVVVVAQLVADAVAADVAQLAAVAFVADRVVVVVAEQAKVAGVAS